MINRAVLVRNRTGGTTPQSNETPSVCSTLPRTSKASAASASSSGVEGGSVTRWVKAESWERREDRDRPSVLSYAHVFVSWVNLLREDVSVNVVQNQIIDILNISMNQMPNES